MASVISPGQTLPPSAPAGGKANWKKILAYGVIGAVALIALIALGMPPLIATAAFEVFVIVIIYKGWKRQKSSTGL